MFQTVWDKKELRHLKNVGRGKEISPWVLSSVNALLNLVLPTWLSALAAPRSKSCCGALSLCLDVALSVRSEHTCSKSTSQGARHSVMLQGSVRTCREESFGSGLDFAVWVWHWQVIFGDNLAVCSAGMLCETWGSVTPLGIVLSVKWEPASWVAAAVTRMGAVSVVFATDQVDFEPENVPDIICHQDFVWVLHLRRELAGEQWRRFPGCCGLTEFLIQLILILAFVFTKWTEERGLCDQSSSREYLSNCICQSLEISVYPNKRTKARLDKYIPILKRNKNSA